MREVVRRFERRIRSASRSYKSSIRSASDPSLAALPRLGAAFRELIGHYTIAMTAVQVCALMESRARVEIEVTAVVPEA